jgi:hypothetical protein
MGMKDKLPLRELELPRVHPPMSRFSSHSKFFAMFLCPSQNHILSLLLGYRLK